MKLSTLSISQRTFSSSAAPPPLALRAREVATHFIARQGDAHSIRAAESFLRDEVGVIFERSGGFVTLRAHSNLSELPSPYGLKGGAARERLREALHISQPRAPRDIDIIRRGRFATPSDEDVAKRFMARDYTHGARVELVTELSRYIASRDLTINEVAVFDSTISASFLAILDTLGHVLRPSRYRGGTIHKKPSLDGRTLLKMARLFAEGEGNSESWLMVGIPEEVSFSDFDLALHVNKSFQRDEDVARAFLNVCCLLSIIPARDDLVASVLQDVEHLRHGERGLLPDVPAKVWVRILGEE